MSWLSFCKIFQVAFKQLSGRSYSVTVKVSPPQSINYLFVCRVSVQKSICLRLSVMGLPGGSVLKNLPAMQETWVWSLGGEDRGEGNDNPLQYSCLGNPMDRTAWWPMVHGVARVRHDSATEHIHTHKYTPQNTCSNLCWKKKKSLQQPGREAGSTKGALGICFSRALYFISDSQ